MPVGDIPPQPVVPPINPEHRQAPEHVSEDEKARSFSAEQAYYGVEIPDGASEAKGNFFIPKTEAGNNCVMYYVAPDGKIGRNSVARDGEKDNIYFEATFAVQDGEPIVVIVTGDEGDPVYEAMVAEYDGLVGFEGDTGVEEDDFSAIPKTAASSEDARTLLSNSANEGAVNALLSEVNSPEAVEAGVRERLANEGDETETGETNEDQYHYASEFVTEVQPIEGRLGMLKVRLEIPQGMDGMFSVYDNDGNMTLIHVDGGVDGPEGAVAVLELEAENANRSDEGKPDPVITGFVGVEDPTSPSRVRFDEVFLEEEGDLRSNMTQEVDEVTGTVFSSFSVQSPVTANTGS